MEYPRRGKYLLEEILAFLYPKDWKYTEAKIKE